MNRLSALFACLLVVLTVLTAVAAPRLSVTLCEDVVMPGTVPVNATTGFTTDDGTLHAVVVAEGVTKGTVARGAWISIDAINVPNHEIDAAEVPIDFDGDANLHFHLSRPDNGWPVGNYRLEVSIDGQLATIQTFAITQGTPQVAPQPTPAQPAPAAPSAPPMQQTPQSMGGGVPMGGSFGGSYVLEADGTRVSLELTQDVAGNIAGQLSSTTGMYYGIEGMVSEGVAVGACYDEQGGLFFEGHPQGDQLAFYLMEADAGGMPNADTATELVFTKIGGAPSGQGFGQQHTGGAWMGAGQQGTAGGGWMGESVGGAWMGAGQQGTAGGGWMGGSTGGGWMGAGQQGTTGGGWMGAGQQGMGGQQGLGGQQGMGSGQGMGGGFAALSGAWYSQTQTGTEFLVFQSENVLIYNGEQLQYTLIPGSPGTIRVMSAGQQIDYPYALQQGVLYIQFPDGQQLQFTRNMGGGQGGGMG